MLPSRGSPSSNRPAIAPVAAVHRNHNDGAAADRRVGRRARLGATVTITASGRLVDGLASDLSAGGMRVVAAAAARVGDVVSVVFFVDGDLVAARGIVRWSVPTQHGLAMFGVLFTTVEDDGRSILASYCHAAAS